MLAIQTVHNMQQYFFKKKGRAVSMIAHHFFKAKPAQQDCKFFFSKKSINPAMQSQHDKVVNFF